MASIIVSGILAIAVAAALSAAAILTASNAQNPAPREISDIELTVNATTFEETVIDAETLNAKSGLKLSQKWSQIATVPARSSESISVLCGSNSVPTGGGFIVSSSDVKVVASHAFSYQNGSGWMITVNNTNTKPLQAVADVLCLTEVGITTPAPSIAEEEAPQPRQLDESFDNSEAIVEITADGDWSGAFSDSDFTSSTVDGSGDDSISIECEEDGIYSVVVQKLEESGTLNVAVVKDGNVLKEASTSADYGVVSVSGEC